MALGTSLAYDLTVLERDMKTIFQIAAIGWLLLSPRLCVADATSAAESAANTYPHIILEKNDARIHGSQSCGSYALIFVQTCKDESEGEWDLTASNLQNTLYHGGWAGNSKVLWSPDCRHLALSTGRSGGGADSMVVLDTDKMSLTEIDPLKLVELAVPDSEKMVRFDWEPKEWNAQGNLIFSCWGVFEWNILREGIGGTFMYKSDGEIQPIKTFKTM
jgi:hypothetical protein